MAENLLNSDQGINKTWASRDAHARWPNQKGGD